MYYIEDATQATIAERLSISRTSVSRLITEARRLGLVRIDVIDPQSDERGALEAELAAALGLDRVRVVAPVHPSRLGPDLAPAVGEELVERGLKPGDILLLSSGRTMYEIAEQPLPRLTGIQLVPTVGGLTEPIAWFQTNEIARRAAEHTGGFPAFVFAEAMPTAQMRASLNSDPAFTHVLGLWDTARGAVVGIGAPTATRNTISRYIPAGDEHFADAAGDITLNFFDVNGDEVTFPGDERIVRAPRQRLRELEFSIGVAVGADKVPSIIGAVRSGMISSLVTDAPTARAVIAAVARRGAED
ncbi:DNA-binding transcriptional regulator [Mycetocola reblochoni]|uniref:DNA-binding transcriptional regulator n=2 Tax=Mycetocola reblochoni TaxID=331618 RepID=A0A3L6ZTJ2_9MICO|nr:DNA-binding transcriptional regulator [Mycetocola reblochoni]